MSQHLTEEEALAFLRAVEAGGITLESVHDPQEIYASNVQYTASNGWGITIFNDCNVWDYIERIEAEDGRILEACEIEAMPAVAGYAPGAEAAWECYGIPGAGRFRCRSCAVALEAAAPLKGPYLCRDCVKKGVQSAPRPADTLGRPEF